MARIALELSYDGGAFLGWQSQTHGRGVQDVLETALVSVGETARATGAGRTDAGVHARGQVAHFDALKTWEPRRLKLALNAHLPSSVSVMRAALTEENFHARKSALWREYRYFIWNAPACYPYMKPYVLWLRGSHYNWNPAAAAASSFVGEHDFRAFCRADDCPANTVRRVRYARLIHRGQMVLFRIVAGSYLTNMVRIAVGCLLEVAAGRRDRSWLHGLIEGSADRNAASRTAVARGLFLWKVEYPCNIWDD
ncbi:MAG: tRNA pseudouridine(38-40) synthase TruA [Synergistaceae bacterium]|nr:tRNA pseudouridine(38-40) synthase TruA [Synergistaceae bacterium]